MKYILGTALYLLLATVVSAGEYYRWLLPVYTPRRATPGSYGTVWMTELRVLNTGSEDIIAGPCAPGFPSNGSDTCPPLLHIFPHDIMLTDPDVGWTEAGANGRFVWVRSSQSNALHFDLRVRNNLERTGAKIPVVREEEFTNDPIYLLCMPVDHDKRTRVRVYGLDDRQSQVLLSIFDCDTSAGLFTAILTLKPSGFGAPDELPYAPAFTQIDLTCGDLIPCGVASVRLTVLPQDGARVWALATTVDNQTQRVLVTAPSK